MKLYYSKGACSLAIRIAIHEIGAPCEFTAVNLKTKQTETGENFLEINPKGAVPALEIDDKTLLTENVAIQQYLADTFKAHEMLPAIGNFERYRVIEWLSYVSSEIHKSFGPFFNPHLSDEVKNTAAKILKGKLQFVNDHLKGTYLTGETFTSADCYLFVMLSWLHYTDIALTDYKNLSHYFDEAKNRKSVMESLKEEGLS